MLLCEGVSSPLLEVAPKPVRSPPKPRKEELLFRRADTLPWVLLKLKGVPLMFKGLGMADLPTSSS